MKYRNLNKRITSTQPGSILARLFRKTVKDMKLIPRLELMVRNYGKREAELYLKAMKENDIAVKKPVKGDLVKLQKKFTTGIEFKIFSNAMTWKSFIEIYFKVLKIKRIKFILILNYKEEDEREISMEFSQQED